jgi:hypothetical protein
METAMNTMPTETQRHDDGFLNLVDFKWLMAGQGWWVNLTRLQRDKAYMHECLARAMQSHSGLLQQRGAALLGLQ